MNYILFVLLVVVTLIVLSVFHVYHLWRIRKITEGMLHRPENLPLVLLCMLKTVKRDAQWIQLESMRNDIRRALRDLDNLRHDVTNKPLRDSKRVALSMPSNEERIRELDD